MRSWNGFLKIIPRGKVALNDGHLDSCSGWKGLVYLTFLATCWEIQNDQTLD